MNALLRICEGLSLPLDIVTQTIAILAKRRAGKSYAMRRICEQLLQLGQQVVIVDPKGDQWGIRTSADGKHAGFKVVILGGEHGDLPLEVNAGEVVAKLVVEERVSVLLDLSQFRKHEIATFMAIFLENMYRLKAQEKYRTPVMLVVDEADAIAPQKPQKGEERMLGAIDDIVRRGGQRGIGCTLVSQRSAVLNKNVLTQAQMLVVLRTIAPHDLAAMKAWIDVHGTIEQGKEMMDSLPSLPTGDAWFWSPGWPTDQGIFVRAHVLPIATFDSGATPKPGERKIVPKTAADVDLGALQKQMAATIEKAKAEDPKLLKKEIDQLKRKIVDLEKNKSTKPFASTPIGVSQWMQYGKKYGYADFFEKQAADKVSGKLAESFTAELIKGLDLLQKDIFKDIDQRFGQIKKNARSRKVTVEAGVRPTTPRESTLAGERRYKAPEKSRRLYAAAEGEELPASTDSLNAGELSILKAVAQIEGGIARRHITALTTLKRSTRDRYLITLKSAGYVREDEGKMFITQEGIDRLGSDYEPLPTGSALQEHLLKTLPEGQAKILQVLIDAHPHGVDRDTITDLTNLQRSTRDRYLLYLSARELVDTSQKSVVTVSDKLFD